MENEKALMLLSSLFAYCSESQKEPLKRLYKEAVFQNEIYIDLENRVRNTSYYGKAGEDLKCVEIELLKKLLSNNNEVKKNLAQIRSKIFEHDKELTNTYQFLASYLCQNRSLSAVSKKLEMVAHNLYYGLLNVLCYYTLTFYGIDNLRKINVDVSLPSLDFVKNVSSELVDVVFEISAQEKPKAWKITKCFFGGSNIIHYYGVKLEYVDWEEYEANVDWKSGSLISSDFNSDVICYGIGDITNATVKNASVFLNQDVIVKVQLNALDKLTFNYENFDIVNLFSNALEGKNFIVSPEFATEILNRYFMMKKVKEANQKQEGIYFGLNFDIPEKFEVSSAN